MAITLILGQQAYSVVFISVHIGPYGSSKDRFLCLSWTRHVWLMTSKNQGDGKQQENHLLSYSVS